MLQRVLTKKTPDRESSGLFWIIYAVREDALRAVAGMNGTEVLGRKIKVELAKDNGRAAEFIKRKTYTDKSRCYECGEEGHLSYSCPKNQLGNRTRPSSDRTKMRKESKTRPSPYDRRNAPSSKRPHAPRNHSGKTAASDEGYGDESGYQDEDFYDDTAFISMPILNRNIPQQASPATASKLNVRKPKKAGYFSDEEDDD
ncbi:Zinc finger CCHC-type and RNA-binding motif-containing protein 1 [Borealophlyctis nickersoniae]|nr:Zinc finger CCHC-type and RNA-binding motif-containing protein 1 [Borealophlyctis nickersoniae]